jgi:S-(hydroxymethyl)glutathione dehydrogenase/alcohol dehydrogenase
MPLAAVCHAYGEPLSVEEVELDPPQRDEVRVSVRACAVCHSDIAALNGAWGGDVPVVLGHEAAGIVEEVGPGADGVAPGDRVVVSLVRHCGTCARCRAGEPTLCTATFRLDETSPIRLADGRRARQGIRCGAFAEEVVVHASQVVPVPEGVGFTTASVIACAVMTGVGAVEHSARVAPGDRVVVIGAGGVGLNVVQAAAGAGAAAVIAADTAPEKLEVARRFGATHVVDARGDELERVVAGGTEAGADFVFAAVGAPRAIERGLGLLRPGGALVVVGMPPTGADISVDACLLAHYGWRILGTKLGGARPREDVAGIAERYARGAILLDELVTGTYGLHEINDAVAASANGGTLRNVITF